MFREKRFREFMRQHPLPNKQLQPVMEEWMIYFAEVIIEEIKKEQNKTNSVDREKRLREFMRQHPLPDKRLQPVMEELMIDFVEEIIEGIKKEYLTN